MMMMPEMIIMMKKNYHYESYVECRGRAVWCIGLGCQNVGSNPSLAGRGTCVREQDP